MCSGSPLEFDSRRAILPAALKYLKRGWSVIPVGWDKKPLVKWKPYQERLPSEDEIRKWWGDYPGPPRWRRLVPMIGPEILQPDAGPRARWWLAGPPPHGAPLYRMLLASIEGMERETLPMRIEAARRGFLLRIQAMRENLMRG